MSDLLARIQAAVESSPDNIDLKLLASGWQEARRRFSQTKSAANRREWKTLEADLVEALDSLEVPCGLTEKTRTEADFAGVKEVLAHLQEQGRKIRQAKLYQDIRSGFLRRQKNGAFRRYDVDRYAATLPMLSLPQRETDDLSNLARQELEERVLKTREQRQSIAFDRAVKEGRHIRRDDVALELAARAMAFSVGIKSALAVAAPDLVAAAGGHRDRADDLVRELEKHLDEVLNEFSRPIRFTVEYAETTAENHEDPAQD
ncbi:MAG: hypothetical protein KUA37_01905 [Desulfomicrobium sp.]|nr:hypothetical protein [Pseudomonadota bacterium]MBV1710745.1 hypothetical protein [Desulfomicrobium sp.]MBU4570353.1 hypothetical protein [Pseudomonadota bacterium]MBU4593274.1 hypothetical protein [Pseudomonadota bacterium]MBV1719827.1 hypothetical protein [Desulfomicrobium sp.]